MEEGEFEQDFKTKELSIVMVPIVDHLLEWGAKLPGKCDCDWCVEEGLFDDA